MATEKTISIVVLPIVGRCILIIRIYNIKGSENGYYVCLTEIKTILVRA